MFIYRMSMLRMRVGGCCELEGGGGLRGWRDDKLEDSHIRMEDMIENCFVRSTYRYVVRTEYKAYFPTCCMYTVRTLIGTGITTVIHFSQTWLQD